MDGIGWKSSRLSSISPSNSRIFRMGTGFSQIGLGTASVVFCIHGLANLKVNGGVGKVRYTTVDANRKKLG